MKTTILALACLLFASCGTPDDVVTYLVSCNTCHVRFSVADTVVDVDVTDVWKLSWVSEERETYGLRVDQVTGTSAAYMQVREGDEVKHSALCQENDGCLLQYVGVTPKR